MAKLKNNKMNPFETKISLFCFFAPIFFCPFKVQALFVKNLSSDNQFQLFFFWSDLANLIRFCQMQENTVWKVGQQSKGLWTCKKI